MKGIGKDLLILFIGTFIGLLGFITTDKLGLLNSNQQAVEQTQQDINNIKVNGYKEIIKLQTNIDTKLNILSLEVSKYAGDMKALQVSIESYNRSSEKDIARLSRDLNSYMTASGKKIEIIEKKLESEEARIQNIESYLKNFARKRGFEFLNLNI